MNKINRCGCGKCRDCRESWKRGNMEAFWLSLPRRLKAYDRRKNYIWYGEREQMPRARIAEIE